MTQLDKALDLIELERLALAASPGLWAVEYCEIGPYGSPDTKLIAFVKDVNEKYIVVDEEPNTTGDEPSPNCAYIAAANPAVVLALIEWCREDAAYIEHLESCLNKVHRS